MCGDRIIVEGKSSRFSENQRRRQLKDVERAFHRNHKPLLGWLTKKLGDVELAREIAQNVYLRTWRYAQSNEVRSPVALIFKAAANLTAEEFSKRRKHRRIHVEVNGGDADTPLTEIPCDRPTQERISIASSDFQRSLQALDALPDNAKRAFLMSRFEDKTYKVIAEELGVSVSSVEKYIILALRELKIALSDPAPNKQPTMDKSTIVGGTE